MNSRLLLFSAFLFLFNLKSFAQDRPFQTGPLQAGPLQAGPLQAGPLLDSLSISHVIAVSHDALGNLYVATADGKLMKYQSLSVEQQYSSASIPMLTSLEAVQMLKIFTFYQNSQQFQFFDRFLTPSQTNTIKTETSSYFSAATLSNDQMIWLFDETNIRLIKYHPILEEVVLRADLRYFLPANAQVRGLKEYGNRLYLWQNHELMVFDFLGNLIQKLPVDVDGPFAFHKNKLYYPEGKQVHVYDLVTMQQKRYGFPLTREIRFALWIENRLSLITDEQIKVFQFEP